MRYANLSAAEEETHTPLALELREVACAAPAGELALRASADYLLARIAALFESHPRLADLGYRPDTTDGQPTRIGLVKIAPPGHDGEYPQFDTSNARTPATTGYRSSPRSMRKCSSASSAPKQARKRASPAPRRWTSTRRSRSACASATSGVTARRSFVEARQAPDRPTRH